MVAVRSMGLSLESVIGRLGPNDETVCIVPESYLNGLLSIANERFEENTRRIARFRALLKTGIQAHVQSNGSVPKKTKENGEEWEDAAARKERKRAEGLARAAEKRAQSEKKGVMLSPSVSDLPLESNLIKEGSEANH
jgi:tRNA wybutosine-synthesizing protein 3